MERFINNICPEMWTWIKCSVAINKI